MYIPLQRDHAHQCSARIMRSVCERADRWVPQASGVGKFKTRHVRRKSGSRERFRGYFELLQSVVGVGAQRLVYLQLLTLLVSVSG